MRQYARFFALSAVLAAGVHAQTVGEHVALVPWKVLRAGDIVDAPLALFWIPASPDEVRVSELLASNELASFSARCVAMRIVRFDDRARLARLGAGEELPAVVLADRKGRVVGRVDHRNGAISLADVERLVGEAVNDVESEADGALDRADALADEGRDHDAAALYRIVREQRCICPRQARDADRALRKLRRR